MEGVTDKTYQAFLNYAFRLLARRDYSEAEMLKKLRLRALKFKKGEEIIPKIIERLKELVYLDDEKFAKQWISNKLNFNPKGKFLLRHELRRKGIEGKVFEKIWREVGVSDEILADRILQQKKRAFGRLKPQDKKKKIMSLLAQRGIAPAVIYEKVENII